ncbi:glycosyltransferase family 9 protein [Arthrobacter sp. zg-Y820]|uniref:glycosyltransferase family 9 protein n=1 Tax=unclassified Arthrobacter TaxID=235627 RepID=UPI001E2B5235|nr:MULTISPECIES: glycosyltransferase family 9 protein [unclassified Arthrobacter]MCC9197313.1 glycosyltransferase family 9 protein [Arthrobacter sp. zg-Y820]MDK1280178.1 glycosyltransferase family 9 protein [Arthrobacter sp. zg.Y820]WIB09469.1 glycosyltransferase family 9 protein [Arthrobacter sp. zg-Y820]
MAAAGNIGGQAGDPGQAGEAAQAREAAPALRRGVGPVLAPFPGVSRIAVLRGGGLGDLMFALPAIEALAAAYPDAEITLLGAPLHAALLAGRPGPVHRVEVLPFASGIRPGPDDPAAAAAFHAAMRARSFDLAVQVHGGGRNSNPFLLQLGAAHTVGTRTPDAAPLERTIPYIYYQHEVLRALEVAGLAGAVPLTLEPQLEVLPVEEEKAEAYLAPGRDLVTLHPGATDPRRRWPASAFAAVAVRAAADGCRVLVVGDDDGDRRLAEQIVALSLAESGPETDVASVAGQLDIGTLAALLKASTVMVGNDSGPRHLAQAVGTPTVGIYWFGNVINAGAMGRTRHRVHMSWVSACPVCGINVTQVGWTAERCAHDDSFVAAVDAAAVYADVAELRTAPPA